MGLGLARQATRCWLRYAAPMTGWLLGFSGHFLNNGIGLIAFLVYYLVTGQSAASSAESSPEAVSNVVEPFLTQWLHQTALRLVGFFPFFLIAGVMLWQSGLWELQMIRNELADGTEPVIMPEEYEGVKRDCLFSTRRISGMNQRLSAAIVRAQNKLAIRKWRVKHSGQSVKKDRIVVF